MDAVSRLGLRRGKKKVYGFRVLGSRSLHRGSVYIYICMRTALYGAVGAI